MASPTARALWRRSFCVWPRIHAALVWLSIWISSSTITESTAVATVSSMRVTPRMCRRSVIAVEGGGHRLHRRHVGIGGRPEDEAQLVEVHGPVGRLVVLVGGQVDLALVDGAQRSRE